MNRRFEAREHHCWADPARLQQVFWNLVKNAAKFTPEGGRIEVSTRNNDAHQIVIEITDNGIGIDPALMPKIFDAFEQGGRVVTSKYGGLGLGLAISKRVVDLHHGSITAQSAGPGQGATFVVTLNAMETSMLEGPVFFLETDPADSRHLQILFVEDHKDTARVLGRILKNAGFDVSHAASLAKARELAAGRRFDLVISDLGLPDGSGLDLMRGLRETQGLSGIALSGFGTDDDVAASTAAGFAEHLTKPVDWEQLRVEIDRLAPLRGFHDADRGLGFFWGAHAPSRAGDGALAIANFIADKGRLFRRGRRNQHARRVRSPEKTQRLPSNIRLNDPRASAWTSAATTCGGA